MKEPLKSEIHLKRVYEPQADDDGIRVLVDRIWPRGVSKEAAALALWLKDIAPTTTLRKWFNHDPSRWTEFRRRYFLELDENLSAVEQLRETTKAGRVTLVYGAHDTAHNHAVALVEYMTENQRGAHASV